MSPFYSISTPVKQSDHATATRRPGRALGWGLNAILVASMVMASTAEAAEGQWTPDQIAELDASMLKSMGLELSPEQLWDGKGGGLLRGVVNVRGCSGGFVSGEGLVATNHHCAYGALQAASRVTGIDYLKDGVLSKTRAEEVAAPGLWIQVLESIDDVSAPVRAAADAAQDDLSRAQAVERMTNELLLKCESEHPARRCLIAPFEMGGRFLQFVTLELRDVRMVFAPPTSLGNYGGEIDNWMWPRHAADVTFIRGYVDKEGAPAEYHADNVPYRSPAVLPMTADGVDDGSFVMTCGYPGLTQRYLSSGEVKRQLTQVFPGVISTYGDWIDTQLKLGEGAPDIALKVAARMRSLQNRHKNAQGMVEGMKRMHLDDKRTADDAKIESALATEGGPLIAEMNRIADAYALTFDRDVVLENVHRILPGLANAIALHRRAREASKPEVERHVDYMERTQDQLWSNIERNLRDYDARVEATLLDDVLRRLRALSPEQQRVVALGAFQSPTKRGTAIVSTTTMGDRKSVEALFRAPNALEALRVAGRKDSLLALGGIFATAIETLEREHKHLEGKLLAAGPNYFDALKSVKGGAVYPDANGTLRFSYAKVRGYSPQDGAYMLPQTTLEGAIAKHTGNAPFVLPDAVLDAAKTARQTAWADGELGALAVNFLSTSDTTGGNSGSPVLDGKGRLVGFNFDRVWENIAGDFGYHPSRSRNVVVDARYILWLLDRVYDASALLDEIGLADLRSNTSPVDESSGTSVTTTMVLGQIATDRMGLPEVVATAKEGVAPPTPPPEVTPPAAAPAPQSTSAVILAAILILAGFGLLITRREKAPQKN